MHKRKYTKEQLEFYFKKLMAELKRVPREEDLTKRDDFPSVKAYSDRFGSWQKAVNQFANFDLNKRKCLQCGKTLIKKKRNQKFCSDECLRKYYAKKSTKYTKTIDNKIKSTLDNKCFVCDFESIIEIHSLDNKKESNSKILKAFNHRNLHDFILLCPNHHQMIHRKFAKLAYKDHHLVWEEILR